MKIEAIYCDIHGVLADFVGNWLHHFTRLDPEAAGKEPPAWPEGVYSIEKAFGLKTEEVWGFASPEFWCDSMKPTSEKHQIIDLFEATGLEVRLVSSAGSPLEIRHFEKEGTTRWIQQHTPYDELRYVANKAEFARPNRILVDDADHQVDAWRDAGGYAIQIPRPWNRLHHLAGDSIGMMCDLEDKLTYIKAYCDQRFFVSVGIPPMGLHPNHRPRDSRYFDKLKRNYRNECRELVYGAQHSLSMVRTRWKAATVQLDFYTESGEEHDPDNAIAWVKAAIDSLERQQVILNDRHLQYAHPRFHKASSTLNTRLEISVTPILQPDWEQA